MSDLTQIRARQTSVLDLAGLSRTIGDLLAAAFDAYADAMARQRQRRALQELPDFLLQDIGLSRADVEGEAGKPFWRD